MFNLTPDVINGLFEFVGGCFLCLNIKNLVRDKEVKGVSWSPVVFMTGWGIWNLHFYKYYNHLWSWYGGMFICLVNIVWLSLVYYYYRKKRKSVNLSNEEKEWREDVEASEELMVKHISDKEWEKIKKNFKKHTYKPDKGSPGWCKVAGGGGIK